jgi:hypothetical protein
MVQVFCSFGIGIQIKENNQSINQSINQSGVSNER